MQKRKKVYICISILILGFLMCGFGNSKEVKLDTEKKIAYQTISADSLLVAYRADNSLAEDTYSGHYYAIVGKVISKKENNKQVSISYLHSNGLDTIQCNTTNDTFKNLISGLKVGDTVRIFGKLEDKWDVNLPANNLYMDIDKIEKTNELKTSLTKYIFLDGREYETQNMYVRDLNKGKHKFFIPASWKTVEHKIVDEGLGNMEGYQYRLNEIDDYSVQPESFYICYFDKSLLANPADSRETKLIEKAIIGNILGQQADKIKNKFPLVDVDTYYGTDYRYYQDTFDKGNEGYHVEFVFQVDEGNGIVVYLYVYKDSNHLDDIMMTMKTLE